MAIPLITNNAYSTLNSSITNSDTTITVAAGEGARFPAADGTDYFYATLIDTSNNLEIVKCTTRSTDTLTVVRAQDNTSAQAYTSGDRIEVRPCAILFEELRDDIADDAITTVKILDANVTAAKLATDAVTTDKIVDDAVTTVKILDNNVTAAKIAGADSATDGLAWIATGADAATWALAEEMEATKDVAGTDGYVKLPGGVILQWGFNSGGGSTETVTYPLAFPTAVFAVTLTRLNGGDSGGSGTVPVLRATPGLSSCSVSSPNDDFYWMAVGN